jgi:hypothetical protein
VGAHERLLGPFVRGVLAAEQIAEKAEHRLRVPVVDHPERALVAACGAGGERTFDRLGLGRRTVGHLPSHRRRKPHPLK